MPDLVASTGMDRRGVPWTREELILVCGLYFGVPFGQMHARNPKVIEMAELLGRTPSSVAMKLVNLASLDPAHQQRGVKGLGGHSRADVGIWREFENNWDQMAMQSEELRESLPVRNGRSAAVEDAPPQPALTEASRVTRIRTMQGFFRRVVLAAHGATCCVSGNPVEELLNASHILPWAGFPEHRLNPRNGLCLVTHLDRAFDRGLVTFDSEFRLEVSPVLLTYLPNRFVEEQFTMRAGQPMKVPERFGPDPLFLDYHRVNVFRRG